jgi:hypothetical protein
LHFVAVLVLVCGCDQVFGLSRPPDAPGPCPPTYTIELPSSPSRYRINDQGTTWDAAEADCANDTLGLSHLAVIDTDAERRELAAEVLSSLWIGLTDRITEDSFLWVTVQGPAPPASGGPWGPGQPDDQTGAQDCVRIQGANDDATFYDDGECASKFSFACECDSLPEDGTRF